MKTADLIPFILLELNDGDKYGFELTKQIETKSDGKIVIKQPTLYTLLKKLEKSKFITSYWQDSEIGGKRHYYKITENGKMQLSTLPKYDILLSSVLNDDSVNTEDQAESEELSETTQVSTEEFEKNSTDAKEQVKVEEVKTDNFSIFDIIDEPKETILPTDEVFSNNSVDAATTFETNLNNTEIVKQEDSITTFAENDNVSKFTETKPLTPPKQKEKIEEKFEIVDLPTYTNFNDEPIKFVDYVSFSNDPVYKKAKSAARNMLYKTLSTSGFMLFILALCGIIVGFTGGSALYYSVFIISLCTAIFYPLIFILKYENFRQKCKENIHVYNTKKTLIIHSIIFAVLLIAIIATNIGIGINIVNMFNIKNFANFYAPILIFTSLYIEILFSYIFLIKKNK